MSLIADPGTYFNPDFMELLEYFGPYFRLDWCNGLDPKVNREWQYGKYGSVEEFNRRTFVFLYHSIGLMNFGTTRLYVAQLLQMTAGRAYTTILDVGAGAGQLGLALHTLGYSVSFADIFGQSLYFLTWRLRKRRLDLPIYILDDDKIEIPQHDVTVCFDVMEHIEAVEARHDLLTRMADMGKLVMVNLPYQERDGIHLAVDPRALTEFVANQYGTFYQDLYTPADLEPTVEHPKPWQRLLIYGKEFREFMGKFMVGHGPTN